jgi:hypothetical protein
MVTKMEAHGFLFLLAVARELHLAHPFGIV